MKSLKHVRQLPAGPLVASKRIRASGNERGLTPTKPVISFVFPLYQMSYLRRNFLMTDLLIVVDMQRDFVSGALGSEQARAIVPAVAARIQQAKAENTQVVFTLDTHEENYMNTREGRFLPVPHCIRDTPRLGA